MNNNIDFKDLWQKKISTPPEISEVYRLAKRLKRQLLVRTILLNIILLLTAAFIIGIWINFSPQLLSTKIGICLTIFAIFSFVLAQNTLVPYLIKEKDGLNLNDYLIQLKNMRSKQLFLQTTMLNIYFLLLGLGVFLYMYEFVGQSILSFSLAYGITSAWFAFNWFYIRPKTMKKQQGKTTHLISKFEELQKQLSE